MGLRRKFFTLESWYIVCCVARVHAYDIQIGKGAAGARGDNTKTLKSAVLDWIMSKGEAIQPPLHRNSKIDRGFNHELTGSLLCPAGLDWNDPQYVSVCSPDSSFILLCKQGKREPSKWRNVGLHGSVAHFFVCPPYL